MADEPILLHWLARLSAALDRAGVPHALAGGLSVAVWAQPRATADIDIVLTAGPDAIERARRACEENGLLQTNRRVVTMKRLRLLRMLIPPGEGPEPIALDLLLLDSAIANDVMRRAVSLPLAGRPVPVVSPEDLVLLKLLRFSIQDRLDIQAVAGARKLDRRYLRRQAGRLRLLTRLRAAL